MTLALLVACLAVRGPAPGPAGASVGERIPLRWEAPQECAGEAKVRAAIDRYLGRDGHGPLPMEVRSVARVRAPRDAKGLWRLDVAVDLPRGVTERVVEAATCGELVAAAGLIIAVAVDPLLTSRRVKPPPEPASPVKPPPPPPPPRLFADLRLGGGVDVGTWPGASGLAEAAVALVGRRFRVQLGGSYLAPRTLAVGGGAAVSVQGGALALRGCVVPRIRRLELPSCAGARVGAARGRGVGVDLARTGHSPLLAVVAAQELVWHGARGVGVFVSAEAVVNALRPRFDIGGLGVVATAGWAAFRAVAGLSVRVGARVRRR